MEIFIKLYSIFFFARGGYGFTMVRVGRVLLVVLMGGFHIGGHANPSSAAGQHPPTRRSMSWVWSRGRGGSIYHQPAPATIHSSSVHEPHSSCAVFCLRADVTPRARPNGLRYFYLFVFQTNRINVVRKMEIN